MRAVSAVHPRNGVFLLLLFAVCACAPVRLVSAYDAILDSGLSDLHTKVVAFAARMTAVAGKPEGTYESNTSFYDEAMATVSTLQLRAGVQQQNEQTVDMLTQLGANLERLRQLHQMGKDRGLSRALADPAMVALEANFKAILTFETAKRRGDDTTAKN